MNKEAKKASEEIGKENFKKRALLNSIASFTDFIAKIGTKFFVSPIILSILGGTLFGIWQIIEQLVGYTKTADVRATQVLKWSISKKRFTHSEHELKEEVTAALYLTFIWVPVFLTIGLFVTWYAPYITNADVAYFTLIRIVTGILVLSLILLKIFDIFESILRGLNIGYKLFGIRALIVVIGGLLQIVVLKQGVGLIGLAFIQLLITLITGLTFYLVVKKNVPWFGFVSTSFGKVLAYAKLSSWYIAFTFTKLIVHNSDRVLLGYFSGPLLVTKYVLTHYIAKSIEGLINNIVTGVIPGLGSLLGSKEFDKVNLGRNYIIYFSLLLGLPLSISFIIYNSSFITLWVGQKYYAGNLENILIILVVVQYIFIGNDESIIKTTLNIKNIFTLNLIVSILLILLSVLLIPKYGLVGLFLSILCSRFILTVSYPLYLSKKYNIYINNKFKKIIGAFLLLFIAYNISIEINLSWISLFIYSSLTFSMFLPITYFVIFDKIERKLIYDNILSLIKKV